MGEVDAIRCIVHSLTFSLEPVSCLHYHCHHLFDRSSLIVIFLLDTKIIIINFLYHCDSKPFRARSTQLFFFHIFMSSRHGNRAHSIPNIMISFENHTMPNLDAQGSHPFCVYKLVWWNIVRCIVQCSYCLHTSCISDATVKRAV